MEHGVKGGVDVEDNAAAHNVACSAEHLGEAGNNDIGVGQHIDVDEGADGLVTDDGEMVLIGKRTDTAQVWSRAEGIGGDFAEESCDAVAGLEQ